jgi:hypothetical protein
MECLLCKELSRALLPTRSEYVEARSSAFYRVSTDIAAKKQVDMERAKTILRDHQLLCISSTRFGLNRLVL